MRDALEPAIRRVLHLYWRFARGLTLGVRALVIDEDRRVFLVKHSYVRGWHLPGGGVEPGETLIDALDPRAARGGQHRADRAAGAARHVLQRRVSRRDHVAVYVLVDFRQIGEPVPDHEIVAHGFFALDELPNDTTAATRAAHHRGDGRRAGPRAVVRCGSVPRPARGKNPVIFCIQAAPMCAVRASLVGLEKGVHFKGRKTQ